MSQYNASFSLSVRTYNELTMQSLWTELWKRKRVHKNDAREQRYFQFHGAKSKLDFDKISGFQWRSLERSYLRFGRSHVEAQPTTLQISRSSIKWWLVGNVPTMLFLFRQSESGSKKTSNSNSFSKLKGKMPSWQNEWIWIDYRVIIDK